MFRRTSVGVILASASRNDRSSAWANLKYARRFTSSVTIGFTKGTTRTALLRINRS